MSHETDEKYAVYILNVPLQFGSGKLNKLLKTNGINAKLVFSTPKKGDKCANVKAILNNAEGKSNTVYLLICSKSLENKQLVIMQKHAKNSHAKSVNLKKICVFS